MVLGCLLVVLCTLVFSHVLWSPFGECALVRGIKFPRSEQLNSTNTRAWRTLPCAALVAVWLRPFWSREPSGSRLARLIDRLLAFAATVFVGLT